eukprot:6173618-Pleurochrysis_carterae.AAC.2
MVNVASGGTRLMEVCFNASRTLARNGCAMLLLPRRAPHRSPRRLAAHCCRCLVGRLRRFALKEGGGMSSSCWGWNIRALRARRDSATWVFAARFLRPRAL